MDQLHTLLPQPSFTIQVMECQQSSPKDSGVHTIANVTILCYGLDTERFRRTKNRLEVDEIKQRWKWNKNEMREHLMECLTEDNLLTPFPDDRKARKVTTRWRVDKEGSKYTTVQLVDL